MTTPWVAGDWIRLTARVKQQLRWHRVRLLTNPDGSRSALTYCGRDIPPVAIRFSGAVPETFVCAQCAHLYQQEALDGAGGR